MRFPICSVKCKQLRNVHSSIWEKNSTKLAKTLSVWEIWCHSTSNQKDRDRSALWQKPQGPWLWEGSLSHLLCLPKSSTWVSFQLSPVLGRHTHFWERYFQDQGTCQLERKVAILKYTQKMLERNHLLKHWHFTKWHWTWEKGMLLRAV